MTPAWYLRRLRRMSPREIAGRLSMAGLQAYWAKPSRRPAGLATLIAPSSRTATVAIAADWTFADMPASPATEATIKAADAVLAGEWTLFGRKQTGVAPEPDWFTDPLTGCRAPRHDYCFDIAYRDETVVGNIKFVWEPSRHQTTQLLASAWWLTGNAAYAERVALHLRSWWRDNPFLIGVHWISGIEVGLRLLSWTLMRALLADWPGCRALFDDNPEFITQLYLHQRYIRAFHSRGSSANNHLIAELAGLASAAVAFPWFAQSAGWADWSRRRLVRAAQTQTDPDGCNREQASDYHLFVFELLLAARLAAQFAGRPLPAALDDVLRRMADALAASLDARHRPPRQGDGDDGRGLLLDPAEADHCALVLGAARDLYGAAPWWPPAQDSVLRRVIARMATAQPPLRAVPRQAVFAGSGQAILRAGAGRDEIWLRCDHGPLGYLSIAAHGHADALSVELRCGGVDVLADPGTYCYHGEAAWRGYFKGTVGHNTLAVDGLDQAVPGGPFLWLTRPRAMLISCQVGPETAVQTWRARHDGYQRLPDPVTHERSVALEGAAGRVVIDDWIESALPHRVRLSFHLGPAVTATLRDSVAHLAWPCAPGDDPGDDTGGDPGGDIVAAEIRLPVELDWSLHAGETDPPLGWYSHRFAQRSPAPSLVGEGSLPPGQRLRTQFTLLDHDRPEPLARSTT